MAFNTKQKNKVRAVAALTLSLTSRVNYLLCMFLFAMYTDSVLLCYHAKIILCENYMNRQHVNVSRGEQINSYCLHLVIETISSTVMLQINCKRKHLISLSFCPYRSLWNIEGGTKRLPYV